MKALEQSTVWNDTASKLQRDIALDASGKPLQFWRAFYMHVTYC